MIATLASLCGNHQIHTIGNESIMLFIKIKGVHCPSCNQNSEFGQLSGESVFPKAVITCPSCDSQLQFPRLTRSYYFYAALILSLVAFVGMLSYSASLYPDGQPTSHKIGVVVFVIGYIVALKTLAGLKRGYFQLVMVDDK